MRNLFYCKDEKIYQYVYIILIILSFIPLFIISFYAHPSADDYSYSIETYRLWSETNNIVVLLKAAYNETVSSWNTWQGLYSSAFLLSLQPAIYGESWYCLTGIIMLSLLIGGNLVVCLYFTTKFLGAMKLEAIVLGLSISFLAIHWMPAISEGVYWYNGAINYGFFYFVLQLCICALVEYTCCKKKEKEIIYFLISSLLVFVLEGGNHVTAFIGLLFTFFLLLIAFISKRR